MQVLIYVVAMEMQMSHKHNGTNEYFQINLVPIDQSIKKLKDSFKPPPPPLHSPRLKRNIQIIHKAGH